MAKAKKLRGDVAPDRREATVEEIKAMAHPLRMRIIRLCGFEPLTNKEIADALRKDPATTLHHVRLLVRTGFLVADSVRTGARGALEKPYRSTGKSWSLNVSRPEHTARSELAVIDAMRDEVADAIADDPHNLVHNTRLGLRLSAARARELDERLNAIIEEFAAAPDDADGERYGLFTTLHRLR